jgi:ubiquitin-protein ligase
MAKQLSLSTTRALTKQLVELSTTKPCEGISVDFSEENIREIFAEIEGPTGTPFEGGVFRVKLLLGDDFPDGPPKGYFLTKVFHPNISECGDICVNVLKKDWKADLGIRHVLLVGMFQCTLRMNLVPTVTERFVPLCRIDALLATCLDSRQALILGIAPFYLQSFCISWLSRVSCE